MGEPSEDSGSPGGMLGSEDGDATEETLGIRPRDDAEEPRIQKAARRERAPKSDSVRRKVRHYQPLLMLCGRIPRLFIQRACCGNEQLANLRSHHEELMEKIDAIERTLENNLHPQTGKKLYSSQVTGKKKSLDNATARLRECEGQIADAEKLLKERIEYEEQKAAEEEAKKKDRRTWTDEEVQHALKLRWDPGTVSKFQDHVTTSAVIWDEIANEFNKDKPEEEHRSATTIRTRVTDEMKTFKLFCQRLAECKQKSGDAGDNYEMATAPFSRPWTQMLTDMKVQDFPNILTPHVMDADSMMQGGQATGGLVRGQSDEDEVTDLTSPSQSTSCNSAPSTASRQLRLGGRFVSTHGRAKTAKNAAREHRDKAVMAAQERALKPLVGLIQEQNDARQRVAEERLKVEKAHAETQRAQAESQIKTAELQMKMIEQNNATQLKTLEILAQIAQKLK